MDKATYAASHTTVAEQFAFHKLNEQGQQKSINIANDFNQLVERLALPEGRYKSLVLTKLEEACFFAKKAMATRPENQA